MSINIPDDPAPNGYVPFPFKAELEAAIEYFRTESVSKDDWEEIKTDPKHGVLAQKKKNDTGAIPLVRGCGIYKDTTPAQLLSIFTLVGVRLTFDDYTESINALQKYSQRHQKFYSVQKGRLFVQARDVVGAQTVLWNDDGSIEIIQTGVPDDGTTPPVSGKTRATLTVGGWALRPINDGADTEVTYLLKTDPNGSLPSWLVRAVIQDYPLLVSEARNFYIEFGFPPSLLDLISSVVKHEKYNHSKREWTATFIGKGGDEFKITVDDKRMYHDGYTISVEGDGKDGVEYTTIGEIINFKVGDAADGKAFSVVVSRKA